MSLFKMNFVRITPKTIVEMVKKPFFTQEQNNYAKNILQ